VIDGVQHFVPFGSTGACCNWMLQLFWDCAYRSVLFLCFCGEGVCVCVSGGGWGVGGHGEGVKTNYVEICVCILYVCS
jgi:hypothetical protein